MTCPSLQLLIAFETPSLCYAVRSGNLYHTQWSTINRFNNQKMQMIHESSWKFLSPIVLKRIFFSILCWSKHKRTSNYSRVTMNSTFEPSNTFRWFASQTMIVVQTDANLAIFVIIVSAFSTKPREFLGARLMETNTLFRLINLSIRRRIHFRASVDAYFHSRSPWFISVYKMQLHAANKRMTVISLLRS